MLAFTVALLLARSPQITDAQLRDACASIYRTLDADNHRQPKGWPTIADLPYSIRVKGLTHLLHQNPTAGEYAGICYSLGISGYKPADMTDRLLAFIAVSHTDRQPQGGDLVDPDPIITAVVRLWKRFPTDAVLTTMLRARGDGTMGPTIGGMVTEVFMLHPRESMRIVARKHLEQSVSDNFWYETTREEARKTDRQLRKLGLDNDPIIRKTAVRVARLFIRSYNENTSDNVPKLKDWTARRSHG